jgi:hypothetical protein
MASAGLLATTLDEEMLLTRGVHIYSSATPYATLESNPKKGSEVAIEIGGRLLLRYVIKPQVVEKDCHDRVFVTPTPYAPDDTVSFLALPRPSSKRDYVMLLRPEKIECIPRPAMDMLRHGYRVYPAGRLPIRSTCYALGD